MYIIMNKIYLQLYGSVTDNDADETYNESKTYDFKEVYDDDNEHEQVIDTNEPLHKTSTNKSKQHNGKTIAKRQQYDRISLETQRTKTRVTRRRHRHNTQ